MKTNYLWLLFVVQIMIFGVNHKAHGNETVPSSYANVINVPTAGSLSSILSQLSLSKDTITSLRITGFLNSSDCSTIRSMSKMQHLDVSSASVANNTLPSSAFSNMNLLKTVAIPNTIESIGNYAFRYCYELTGITLPDSLKTIGSSTFYECKALKQITFKSKLQSIDREAFALCESLSNVSFNEGLQTIGYQSFYGCRSLSDNLELPSTLVTIDGYAFSECSSLSGEVVLPANIASLGSSIFYNCKKLTTCRLLGTTPPTLSNSSTFANIKTVFVPESAVTAYKNANYWKEMIIIGGEPASITLDITTAGTLGEKILEQFSFLSDVNILKVSGSLNSVDFNHIQKDMVNLISVDLSGCVNTELPDNLFQNRAGLLEVKLPAGLKKTGRYVFQNCHSLSAPKLPVTLEEISEGVFQYCYNFEPIDLPEALKTIKGYAFYDCQNLLTVTFKSSLETIEDAAFYGCNKLNSVILPNSLKTIGSSAFAYCYNFKSIVIPNNVTYIGSSAFNNCTALTNISIPDHITTIYGSTFYNCTSLASIQLPSKLTTINGEAFRYCTALEEIILPSGLSEISYYRTFDNCTSLKKITCLQPTPPILTGDPFGSVDKTKCELVVPVWGETMYKLANYWISFTNVTTYNAEIEHLPISASLIMANNLRPLGTPSVTILPTGDLTVRGNAPFSTNEFVMKYNQTNTEQRSRLLNECNAMTAQQAKIDMKFYGYRWYYLSFPFDVDMSDITISNSDIQYVIREYDGNSRAAIGAGSSWVNVAADGTLYAGKGYIFQCSENVESVVFKATASSKNKLFSSDAQGITLNKYTSQNAADDSWNLVGNPFPAYFDIRCIDYTAPITIWNGSSYAALSPVDDEYILTPFQAFFVQKPEDLATIVFNPEGRQTTTEIQPRTAQLRSASADRTLINLMISDSEYSDKARIVINPEAKISYELENDAAKFMSTNLEVPQLYSLDASVVNYAINERPTGNGIVQLGYYAGKAGEYTIKLTTSIDGMTIKLLDKENGSETDLNTSEYPFSTNGGKFDGRFELLINNVVTGIENGQLSETRVYNENNTLVIENGLGQYYAVYSLSGIKVADGYSNESKTSIALLQGAYVIKVGKEVFKAVIH